MVRCGRLSYGTLLSTATEQSGSLFPSILLTKSKLSTRAMKGRTANDSPGIACVRARQWLRVGVMRVVQVSSRALIPAPPQAVYSLIADYRGGHPRMLPRRYFPRLEVERGGSGAGTIIRFEVKLFGTTRRVR